MSYNGGNRGDIGRGPVGSGGEIRESLHGPSAGKAISAGFAAIHSQPPLLIFYLFFSSLLLMFFSLADEVFPGAIYVVAVIIAGLILIFLKSGVMGSIELILLKEGWIPAAVLECGKLYFTRFFITGVIFLIANCILSIPLSILSLCLGLSLKSVLSTFSLMNLFLLIILIQGVINLVLTFFVSYILASIIIENLTVISAIRSGFQIVMYNKRSVLGIWLILCCVPALLIVCVKKYLIPSPLPADLINSVITSYLDLILMATSLYFVLQVKRRHSETATR